MSGPPLPRPHHYGLRRAASSESRELLSTPVDKDGDKLWGTPIDHVDGPVHNVWTPWGNRGGHPG